MRIVLTALPISSHLVPLLVPMAQPLRVAEAVSQ